MSNIVPYNPPALPPPSAPTASGGALVPSPNTSTRVPVAHIVKPYVPPTPKSVPIQDISVKRLPYTPSGSPIPEMAKKGAGFSLGRLGNAGLAWLAFQTAMTEGSAAAGRNKTFAAEQAEFDRAKKLGMYRDDDGNYYDAKTMHMVDPFAFALAGNSLEHLNNLAADTSNKPAEEVVAAAAAPAATAAATSEESTLSPESLTPTVSSILENNKLQESLFPYVGNAGSALGGSSGTTGKGGNGDGKETGEASGWGWLEDILPLLAVGGLSYFAGKKL